MKRKQPVAGIVLLTVVCLTVLAGCGAEKSGTEATMDQKKLEDFAVRYAAAWSGGDSEAWAAFYAEDATFRINDGEIARRREGIAEVGLSFMTAFPDMVVALENVVPTETGAEFHWRWTGTNTGPGGSGRPVDMKGFERWTFNSDGLIQSVQGHFDDAEYARQMGTED